MERISTIFFYLGLVLGGYGYFQVYLTKRALPEGVCPIDSNSEFLILSIVLLVVSVILSFVSDYRKKKSS